jgi:hypothetical protein
MVPGGSIRMCQNESFIIETETSGASQGNRSPGQLENGMCEEIEVAVSPMLRTKLFAEFPAVFLAKE